MEISVNYTLEYIKDRLGFPYQVVELSDDDIVEKVILSEALSFFSRYYPAYENFVYQNLPEPYLDLSVNRTVDPASIIIDLTATLAEQQVQQASLDAAIKYRLTEQKTIDRIIGPAAVFAADGAEITFKQINRAELMLGGSLTGSDLGVGATGGYSGDCIVKTKMIHKPDLLTMDRHNYYKFLDLCVLFVAKRILPIRKYNASIETVLGSIVPDVETVQDIVDKGEEFLLEQFKKVNNHTKAFHFKLA